MELQWNKSQHFDLTFRVVSSMFFYFYTVTVFVFHLKLKYKSIVMFNVGEYIRRVNLWI